MHARESVHQRIGFLEVVWARYCSISCSGDAIVGVHSNGHQSCATGGAMVVPLGDY